jgi:Fur family ferric uptake transcriptional regulator
MAHAMATRWEEHARSALAEAGHRSGGAREAVVELLAGQDCCLSAHEIAEKLHRAGSGIGKASVYRALDLLHQMDLVQRVEIDGGGSRYEPVVPGGEHHHHAVCETCGKVTPFADQTLERALERLSGRLKHSMRAHDIVIRGDCSRCART